MPCRETPCCMEEAGGVVACKLLRSSVPRNQLVTSARIRRSDY
ncbi:Uncharacterised protein [Vibrio cholerae]|nr:Uncharacterised protein [Vibrio cholerae]